MTVIFDKILDRYIVINQETGEIIDDAQGYGFKTKQGAIKAMYWKNNQEKLYKESILITDWWNMHQKLYDSIVDDIFFITCKNHINITTKELKEYLNKIEEFKDAPFEPYKMYKHYDSSYNMIKQIKKKNKKQKI